MITPRKFQLLEPLSPLLTRILAFPIGLRDSELFMLVEAIMENVLTVKSNKIPSHHEAITLKDWCMKQKYDGVIKNELMFEFKGKLLPSKEKGFNNYTNKSGKS
jgi:hypothetical protein